MAKKKTGPALLELIHQEQQKSIGESGRGKRLLDRLPSLRRDDADDESPPEDRLEPESEPVEAVDEEEPQAVAPAPPEEAQPEPEPEPEPAAAVVTEEPFVERIEAPPEPVAPVRAEPARRHDDLLDDGLGPEPPMVQVRDGRVRISLNPVSAIVVGGGVLLAIFAGFVLGRVTAPTVLQGRSASLQTSNDPLEEAAAGPAKPSVLVDPSRTAVPTAGRRETLTANKATAIPAAEGADGRPDPRQAGLNYFLVLSARPEHGQDAMDARDFLNDRGVQTLLVQDARGWWRLYDVTKGYHFSNDRTEHLARKETLRHLGIEFQKTNLRYSFDPFLKLYAADG